MMSVLDSSLTLYRKTVKRFKPAHIAMHRIMSYVVIPFLEKVKGFQTIEDDPFWFRLELLTNRHEIETTQQIQQLIKPNMIVLDVGAHVGYYSRMFSALVGDKGQIIAFEPHPRTHAILKQNVGNLSNVTTHQIAVAEQEGTAELYDYLMMSASGSLHYDESLADLQRAQMGEYDVAPRHDTQFEMQKFTVKTVPIDKCLMEMGIQQVDFVKMDVEGAEMGALRSMKQTIANSPNLALIMEYNPQALKAFDHDPVQALTEILSMGFSKIQAINPDGSLTDWIHDASTVQTQTQAMLNTMGVINLLFTR
jgi:FkbM family methyltransferase